MHACSTDHTHLGSPVPQHTLAKLPGSYTNLIPAAAPAATQAADINALFGFRLECLERLGDEEGIYVWKRINQLFNWLPLAANIENKILCMHGGIGRCIHKIDQIAQLKRPITMEEGGPVLMDLLWSDPTTNDAVVGVQPSPRGPGLVTFGPDRVKEFCKVGGGAWLLWPCWLCWPAVCAAAVCLLMAHDMTHQDVEQLCTGAALCQRWPAASSGPCIYHTTTITAMSSPPAC